MSEKCTPEYNEKTRRLMAELEDLEAQAKEARKNATRQRQLEKQTAGLKERVRRGDTSRPPKREPIQYDEAVQNALAERNYYKGLVDNLIAKGERMNTSRSQKIFKTINDMQMASILLSAHVYGKLAYAVLGGHVMDLFADMTRSGARHIPGLKGVFDKSPMYGEGVTAAAYKARAKGVRGAVRQAKIQILRGQAERESAYGKVTGTTDEFFTFAGSLADAIHTPGALNKAQELGRVATSAVVRTHAAVKEFLSEPSFQSALVMYGRGLARIMKKEGKSEAEIKEFFSRESTQAALGMKAVEKAYADKMQGKTHLNSTVNIWLRNLDKQDTLPSNTLAFLFRTLLPIKRIGLNVLKQGSDLGFGGVKAAAELMKGGDMTAERADYIARNIGRQGAGAALLLIGAIYYKQFGGVPGAVPYKKNEQGLHPDESTFMPGGSSAFHGAPFAMLQIGATMAQLYHKEFGEKRGFPLAVDVIVKPSLNWFERTFPYTDQARRLKNLAEYGRARKEGIQGFVSQEAGNVARSVLIPGFVQQAARAEDPYKGFYRPQNFFQDIQLGIPGERQKVSKEHKKGAFGG